MTEIGGAATARNSAVRRIRLRLTWQHVTLVGRIQNRGRTFLSISLVQETDIFPHAAFFVDDATMELSS